MAACPICGLELPGNPARCPACNADLADASALMSDILGATPAPRPAAHAKPAVKVPIPYAAVALSALAWGVGAAALFGIIAAVPLHALLSERGTYTGFITGLGAGGVIGMVLGTVWGATSVLKTELGMSALIGLVLGAVEVTIHYYIEWAVLARGDLPVYMYTLMGCGAGAAVGACCAVFRSYRENE